MHLYICGIFNYYPAEFISLLANSRFDLQGRKPYEEVMNYTLDVSEYVSFKWFQWCWYFDEDPHSMLVIATHIDVGNRTWINYV